MNEAREILRQHTVEIDVTDHREPEKIVAALGLQAITSAEPQPIPANLPAREDRIERRESRPYFA